MLDVNLGNKTLVIGVLVALILSYGMVNFDSGSTVSNKAPGIRTAFQPKAQISEPFSTASVAPENDPAEASDVPAADAGDQPIAESTDTKPRMSIRERRHLGLL